MDHYRGMLKDSDGLPVIGPTRRTLGTSDQDVPVDEDGNVHPVDGDGMSVTTAVEYLPPWRRPPELGGDEPKMRVWRIDGDEFRGPLTYQPDEPDDDGVIRHGVVGPSWTMQNQDLQDALAETRQAWNEVIPV